MLPRIKFFINLLILFFVTGSTYSQKFVDVLNETLTVNSKTAIGGYTRNKTSVRLPEKTKGYIYRITIADKGSLVVSNTLFSILKNIAPKQISLGVALTEYAVSNSDNESVDAFIFTNVYDAEKFYSKKDGEWDFCYSMSSVSNSCRSVKDCIGELVYFGFRNGNFRQGLDVKLEVVAIVDESQKNKFNYTFCIVNSTDVNQKYYLSVDNKKWELQTYHKKGYSMCYTYPQNYLYARIYTTTTTYKTATLYSNQRYTIYWNKKTKQLSIETY
jgi:hypothetical protein